MTGNFDISGVWRLRDFYVQNTQTGERFQPFGVDPRGSLILHPEGRMMAVVTPNLETAPESEADRAAAFQRLIAYSGRYRLEPPNQFVTTVDVAWFQPWVGTEQARTYKTDGDTLDIISAPVRSTTDELMIGFLSWVRETAQ
jgi:Lipocalin-like domain